MNVAAGLTSVAGAGVSSFFVNDQVAEAPKTSVTDWLPSATKSPVTRYL